MSYPKIFLCCFYLCTCSLGSAQTETYLQEELPAEFDNQQDWEDITNRSELAEFKEYVNDLDEERAEEEEAEDLSYNLSEPHPAVVALIKFLVIATGIGIIAFLLYKLLGEVNAPKNRRIKKGRLSEISLEEIEEHIEEADLPDFIEQAIAEKNYNLAIRLYYLLIIKELSARDLIQYKKDKTNRSYLRELNNTPFYADFRQTTQVFERVWYGKNDLTAANFQQIRPTFQQFVNSIQNQPTAA